MTATVSGGWLEIVPHARGAADVVVAPSGGGDPASARVVVRAAIGTFGIDIVMDRPAPVSYERELMAAADWWSSALDGTEWPDRRPDCFNDLATALADELLIYARIDPELPGGGYANPCFRDAGEQAALALDPGGGMVSVGPGGGVFRLVWHEMAHLLGLVLWASWAPEPDPDLVTQDGEYFIGPRAVTAFRESGGDPGLPGVPIAADRIHWSEGVRDAFGFHPSGETIVSVAALADAGYTVQMSKATPVY